MSINVRIASSDDDRRAAYRLRYEVYVEEMGRTQQHADHHARIIEEPLDAHAAILVAEANDRIVGTLRLNVGSGGDFGKYADLYRLDTFQRYFPSHVSISTKFIVAKGFRGTPAALKLATASFRQALAARVCFDVIDTNEHLAHLYEKLGYRQLFADIAHPEYGCVSPMVLVLHDKHHLHRMRSPFSRLLKDGRPDIGSVAFFYEEFLQAGSTKDPNTLASAEPPRTSCNFSDTSNCINPSDGRIEKKEQSAVEMLPWPSGVL